MLRFIIIYEINFFEIWLSLFDLVWCITGFYFGTYCISRLHKWSIILQMILTNLLNFSNSIQKMNKQVNYDLKNLNNWLNGNKICLKSLTKQTDSDLHIKLNGKRLYPTDSFSYFGIIIDKNLNWYHSISNVAVKRNRANAISIIINLFCFGIKKRSS